MQRNTSISSNRTVPTPTVSVPRATRSTSAGSTVLVNLDIYVVRATIGRDISPDDDDLIVLFRRNSKEVTSEPTRWHADHVAEWNQHVGIQTSLLRSKTPAGHDPNEYLSKEYEVVLVALPSHSAVALFTIDFATIVHTQRANRPKAFRISPAKCRDLAATLEFEVVWEFASPPPPPLTPTSSSMATGSSSLSMAGRRTNVSVVSRSSQSSELTSGGISDSVSSCGDCRSYKRRLERKEMQIVQLENFLKESQKRIDSLVFENEELLIREEAETKNAGQYRALNMRLLQELEMAFQFCVQQMLEAQKQAEATGVDTPPALFMFLPQFEFMERVKKFHAELDLIYGGSTTDLHDSSATAVPKNPADAWKTFNFRSEMDSALDRNLKLQHQLEFLTRSLAFDGDGSGSTSTMIAPPPDLRRNETNASTASAFSINDIAIMAEGPLGSSRVAPVRSVTEQLNALERENFLLKAKLDSAMNDLKNAQHGHGGSSPSESAETATSGSTRSRPSSITTSLAQLPVVPDDSPLQFEVDQLRDEKHDLQVQLETMRKELEAAKKSAALNESPVGSLSGSMGPGGSDFLNKIYMDVGKAKVALEEKVKRLTQELMDSHDENARLQERLKRVDDDDDVLSDSDHENEPKIVEILSDDEDNTHTRGHRASPHNTTATRESSTDGEAEAERAMLESQLQQLQHTIEEKTSLLKVQEQELEFVKQHLKEKAALVTGHDKIKADLEKELETTKQALAKAQKKITALEINIETIQHEHMQERDQQRGAVSRQQAGDKDEEVAELTKQLKLARQEVMQLRYRSNNLESVHEKLEEALKEKKTLQVKLTALEGQLFEQRSRTISGTNFSGDGAKDAALVEELQMKLDQKIAQLNVAQRDIESMRREMAAGASRAHAAAATSDVELASLESKVTRFAADIEEMQARNEEQAMRINALSERVEKVSKDKRELEAILEEMMKELETPGSSASSAPTPREISSASSSSYDSEELEEKAPAPIPIATGNKVVGRYTSALKSKFERRGSAPRPPAPSPMISADDMPKNKVAHLIKNFSSEEIVDPPSPAKRRSSTLNSFKKITKIDFRNRHASDPTHF